MEFRQIKMEDNRIYHLRRIGPRATLSNAANLMDFHRIVTLIGRSNNMDYVIDSSIRERSIYISRLHARLVREEQNNTHRLFDDSQNGIFVNNIKIGDSIVLQEGNTVTFGHPNGENIQTGEKRRQPDSEYQFIFERCMCANQNKSRTLTSPITNVTLNSNNTVANMTNKTNNEETTSITSMEKTCAFNNNMPSEISLTTEIRTPSLGEESLIFTSIKKTFDEIVVEKCDDEVQQTTRRKSTTVLGEVNEYHSNNWHDLSQFGNRSAAENDNSDEVDNENIAEDDTVQSVSEVRGDNTLKELVSEVKGDNTLKEPMLFHETLGIEQRTELSGVISGTDSNSTGFSTTADTNLKDKESKPLTADQETIDATERMSTDYNISNTYSEAVLCAKQVKIEVNDANDLKDNVLNIDNYDGKRQINCQELDGENQEIDSENRELDGENREFDGENRELVGENQELDGENRELDDENQELDGENRKLDGENRELDGVNRKLYGENQELEDKNRDLDCENQGLDSTSEDLIDKIQNMIDELECLENKDHNIADEEKLLEDDDDQESENHYQRNGGCKALNCKMDYYYQNVVNEDPEFDGDDQELIDADQGSHENEISEQESGEEIQKSNSDNQESIDPRITSNDNLHNAAYVHDEEINKDEDDYEEEIDDEKSDFNVENRESVNVDQVDVASKTLHQDLEADIKTSQVDDPEFDGEDPDLDDNDLTFDDNDSDFDDGGKKFDNNDFKFDGNSSDFDGKDPKFDGGDSEFDGGDSEFGDNDFKFDGNYLDFDPEFEKLDSDTNRISNTNLDKRNLNLVDNEISQHAVNTYDSNVPNEHDNDSSRNVDKENQHAEIVDSEFDKANRIENMCITMSSHEFTTEAESECLAEPSVYIVTTETECGSISLSKSEFTTEAECGSISLSTSEFKTETESESFTKPSVVTTETECGSISLSASEFTTETEYGSISLSTSEFKTETESESLAEPSVVTTETECGSISLSSSEFTTETENGSIAESASQFTTEAECGSICLSTSEVTTETENESLGKFSVVTNEIAHGTIGSSSQDLSNETEGESLAESSEVKPVTATESESLAESSVVTTRTECDDLSQSTQESKITIEKEILAESSVVMTETEHVTINQCLPCVTTETERIFQSSEKLSVKNESSSKSVEQTNLLERSEFGMGGDETAVKLTERTIILDSKDGLKEIEFVETETRNKLKEYRIERQDTVAKIIPTELKTTKNYEPSEIKLIEYNEILTELKTTKNCEPSEIKLVENNEIEPFDLNCTCVKELSERCIDTAVKIEKRESFELANYKDNFLKDLDENIGYSRKRKLPSEFDSSFQNIGKKIHIDTGFVSDMVSGFFRIREIVAKQSEVDTKTLKRKLVDKMVRNFFERFTKSDAPKEMCCNLSDNLEFLSILESVSMWTKKSLKYLVKNDLKALEINGLCNESLAGDNIVNKSSTASTENCNSLESILINKLSQTQPAHAHSDFEMSQENLEDYMKFRSDSPSEYELVIIGPHHLVNGFNDQKVYGTANNSMFENEVSVYGNKEEKSKKLDTEEILCENRKATKSIMSSEVNLTKEVNMENVDRDQGLTQYTGESQDVHNDLDLTQCIGEFQDVHHDLDLTQCTGESQDVHHDLDLTQCIGESEDVHHNLYLTQCTGESQDVHPDLNLTQCIGESQVVHNDLYLTQCTGESQDIHHDLDLTQCTGESQNVHPDLNVKQQLELSQEHTTDIMVENKAQFSSQHYMKISPDGNCGGISKYLTSKIGDSKHDDDEKVQHKNMVPVHNMLRGYIVSGASVGDAISIMGTSAGDDNDMVGTTSDDERLIMDLDRENSDINNTMCENKVYTNLKTKETPSSMIRSDTEKSTNMIFDEGIKDSDSNCIQMLPLNVDEVTLKSNLVRNDAESIVEELPHIQDECYDLDDGESLDKIGTSGDGDDRIHNVANAETATTSIYHKGKEYINLDVMIDSEENLNDIDAEEKLDVINAEQTLDEIDGDEDVCVFSAAENMDDSTDSVIMLPPTENFSYSRNVLPSPDLYFDDSDSLPEVEFLKESPVKHPVIIKDEIFKVDSGLVSDQDTVIIPFNKALIASTLVVDKNNTSSKSDMNKCAKKEFVFHSTPRDDAASSGKKCVRIPDCTPTNGKVKAETSTPQKHKLKLTKCEKKKKETSLPRKNICQKELGENDNNPRKCKYKRKDFSPRTKTSQRETGTNENIPCKSRLRKRRLDNSPKINDTPAKEGKKSKKKRKMGKHHSRIISDDIEIITDNESDIELTNEKQTMVKSEKLNKSLQRKNEPSIVEFTDERSVTHNSVNQKEDFSFGSKTYVWQENDNENQNEEQLNGSASDIDNISSEDSMSLLSSQQNTMTVDYQHEPPQEEGSELSICYSNTMVANSVTDDDSICFDNLPAETAPFCSTFNEDDSECLACRTETSTANELKRELNIKTEKDTETFWENSHIFSTVTSGTADDTSTSNVLQRELNTKIEKDSEMLWENSHIFSTVTPGTADDTSTANDVQRELNIKTEKDSEMLWENSHICSAVTSGTTDDTSTANDLKRELNIKTEKDNKTWENSNIFSTVTSGTTDDSVSYTQGSSNGNMQKFFRKDKKGINRLLEKCKANIKKLVFPKVEVMHMMQNEAGPSNNTGPDSRMGVSSDLDRCKELILKLTNTLGKEQGVENRNRVEAWREQLKELDGKCSVPSVTVGVVGSTGTGKSSLLNAIIDEYNVLPTSGTQACTAVVVKIQNNYNNNDLYEADIEFLSTEEWDYELQLLKKDLTDKNGKMKKKKKMNISPESEAGVAYLKITAVYGEFDSFEDLEKQTNITSYLGKTETIKSEWASDFRNQVDKFIENTTAKTGQFWPIIKSVTIRIPRCGVCSSGVTLVDLPGVGDANAARDKIAQEYLQNCSVILIATEISRACSSKTAKHLRDENFRRQLLMDGQYGNVAFVCTKNDVLSPTELIRELKLEDKTDHLRKNLNAMNIRVDELNKDALSRKNKELSQDKQNEIESLEAKKNKLEKEMASTRKTIKLICAKARTEFVSKEIKKDFKTGIKEMKKKAKMTQEKIEEDDEDSTDSDDDDDNDVDDSHLTNYCENLKVFCVSSSEYQKLKNKLTDDGPPMVFDCEEDTGIPAVRQFVQKIAEQKEKEATKRLIQNLALFISDIEDYLGITCENNRAKVQSAVTHFSSRLMKELSPGLDKLSNTLSKEINHIAVLLIEEGVKMAVKCAFTTCLQWGLPVEEGGFSLMTYQATIRRNGEYKSKASGNINFNEDLVTPLISSITIEWNNFFSSELWDILDKYKQEIQQTYRTFTNALCKELHSLNLSMTDLKKTRSLLDLHVKNLLTEMIIDLEKVVANRQRNINRMFTPIIKERLMETYDKCKKEKGKGVFNRIKLKLQAGVDHSKCTMFDEASYTVQSQLKQLMKEVISKIWDVCQKICEISSTLYEPFWDSSEASKQLKTTLYDDITEAALTISDLCSKTGVELPLRAATSTEPMSHTASPQMSPSTRAVTSPTEISITSSSRSEIHQLPTSVYSVNDMPSCSTTNVRTESYPEKPPKEKKPRIPESSKRKSSDDEDDKPQRKPVAKRPKMAAFSDSDMSEEEFMPKKRKAVTKSVQVKIELGHRAQRESPSPDGYTHDWRVYVRGPEGCNIAHFIEKVVFHLHQSFPHPKRVVSDPPYQVTERGYAGFLLPIDIYFKNKKKPKKISFQYDLFLLNLDDTPVNHIQCEKLTFQNPTEEFKKKLLKAGGVKMDTRLAPEHRQKLSDDQKERFDNCVNNQNCSDLYLTELKEGKKVGKSKKTFLKDDDVGLLVHDSEVVKKVTYKCKLLQFHMDDSPYYGTWTKKATNVGPRTPFKLIRINAQSSRPSTPLSPGSSKQSSVSQCVTPQKAIPLSPSVSTMPEKERLRMKRMISKVNKKNFKGETPLHTACIKNDVLKLGQLLKVPGVNVNIQDNAGWTPMHEACNHGSTQCVKELLRFVPAKPVEHYFSKDGPRCKKVDLLISNADGITPLHDAVNNNRKDICLLLLQHAGPVLLKQKTVDGYTPLDLASDDDIADLLLSFSDEQITGTSFR